MVSVTGLAGSSDALLPQPLLKAVTRQSSNSTNILYKEAENFFDTTDMKNPPERVFLEKKGKNKENLPLSYPKSPFSVVTKCNFYIKLKARKRKTAYLHR